MKALTIHQLRFALATAVLTILFQIALYSYLAAASPAGIWVAAVIFFLAMFGNGWYFGRKDASDLPLAIASFRFHLLTFLVFNAVSLLWSIAANGSISQKAWLYLIPWAVGLAIHGFFVFSGRRNRIEGINKADIFE